jgi:putative hemolysin
MPPDLPPRFVDVGAWLAESPATRKFAPMAEPISRILAISRINARYDEVMRRAAEEGSFFKGSLRCARVTYQVSAADLARIPPDGPAVVVCNHPFGALDGLILGALLEETRPDFRILGNLILGRIAPIRPWVIPVNPFASGKGSAANTRGLRAALGWLDQGGVVAIFPAGEVARFRLRDRSVRDPRWSPHAVALARRAGAPVVPVFIHGRNSLVFQSVGAVHPVLRTLMLPRELVNKAGHHVPVSVGPPIHPEELDRLGDDLRRTRFVRLRTEWLASRPSPAAEKRFVIPPRRPRLEPVAAPVAADDLAADVAALPSQTRLFSHRQFDLFLAPSDRIPRLLPEIGRLREVSFRQEGEGTGRDRDLDRFDAFYDHLFLWDRERRAVAGAYRVARTDEILRIHGRGGLYTSTLFRLGDRFLEALDPALELGRSFVAPDYQRAHQTLLLLWRGVTTLVGREPRYHRLFGPVSISNTYSQASKALIAQYLQDGNDAELRRLAPWVRPRRPFRRRRLYGLDPAEVSDLLDGMEDVSTLISQIETDGKGLPVLLKHYLRMHTTLLSFNVDRDFSNCLDGLIITDLLRTNRAFLKRIMSAEGIRALDDYGKTVTG